MSSVFFQRVVTPGRSLARIALAPVRWVLFPHLVGPKLPYWHECTRPAFVKVPLVEKAPVSPHSNLHRRWHDGAWQFKEVPWTDDEFFWTQI